MRNKLESSVDALVRWTKVALVVLIAMGVYTIFDGFLMSSERAARSALPAVEKMLRGEGLSMDDVAGPVCCNLSMVDRGDALAGFFEYGDYILWTLEWIYVGSTESRIIQVELAFDGVPEFTHFVSRRDVRQDDLEWAECVVQGLECEPWQSRFR